MRWDAKGTAANRRAVMMTFGQTHESDLRVLKLPLGGKMKGGVRETSPAEVLH